MVLNNSLIDFVGGALRAPPRANRPLSDVGPEGVKLILNSQPFTLNFEFLITYYSPSYIISPLSNLSSSSILVSHSSVKSVGYLPENVLKIAELPKKSVSATTPATIFFKDWTLLCDSIKNTKC